MSTRQWTTTVAARANCPSTALLTANVGWRRSSRRFVRRNPNPFTTRPNREPNSSQDLSRVSTDLKNVGRISRRYLLAWSYFGESDRKCPFQYKEPSDVESFEKIDFLVVLVKIPGFGGVFQREPALNDYNRFSSSKVIEEKRKTSGFPRITPEQMNRFRLSRCF